MNQEEAYYSVYVCTYGLEKGQSLEGYGCGTKSCV